MFLDFIHPGSRLRITPENVDRMLPLFDEYQVHVLKEECQDVLLTMPCTHDRLLQAHQFHMQRAYQRCLQDLSSTDFIANFAILAKRPQVLRDLLPVMQTKMPGLSELSPTVQALLDKPTALEKALPFVTICVKFADQLTEDHVKLVEELSDSSGSVGATAKLFEQGFQFAQQLETERKKSNKRRLTEIENLLAVQDAFNTATEAKRLKILKIRRKIEEVADEVRDMAWYANQKKLSKNLHDKVRSILGVAT